MGARGFHRVSMKQLVGWILSVVIVALLAHSPALSADRYQLDSQLSLKPTMMPPVPDGKMLEKDVDQAIAEIAARKRDEELLRGLVLTPHRRPDLDYDVISGIQSRNLENALRRRR
jgi:hypothetical protein